MEVLRHTDAMNLDDAADELYGVPPEKFIEARALLAKEAREDGDVELAAQIKALRKPTTAAWLANAMVREHPDEVASLLELGRELRAVMTELEPEELRELTRQRHALVSALVLQARALARSLGQRVTESVAGGLRSTLEATLADPDSAAALAAGRLTEPLEVSGFGPGAGGVPASATPSPPATVTPLSAARSRRDSSRRAAEKQLKEAEGAARQARTALEQAEADVANASAEVTEAEARVEELRAALADAEAEVARRSDLREQAARRRDDAQVLVERADQRRDEAQRDLASLPTS